MEAQFMLILSQIEAQFHAAAAEQRLLAQNLNLLAAQVDSLARAQAGQKAEEEEDPIEMYTSSCAAQQAALDAELNRVASGADHLPPPRTPKPPPTDSVRTQTTPHPSALLLDPTEPLDRKYVDMVASKVPLFKTAGSVTEATAWLHAAWSARVRLSKSGQPPAADALFASAVADRLQGDPHQWFRLTFLESVGGEAELFSTTTFLTAFEKRYILSRHVQQSVRTQLLDLPSQCAANRWGLQSAYTKMTQLLALMPTDTRTSVPDQITLLMKCILDDEVRRDANRGEYDTLEDAYQAILRSVANRAHNRTMTTPKPKPYSPKPPRFQQQQPRSSHTQIPFTAPSTSTNSTPPTAPCPAPTVPVPFLAKLTQEERQRCIQHNLCFRCREPGHSANNCPLSSKPSKN
jgi:Zinc knuckle